MYSRRKLVVLSIIFNLGISFFSHAFASTPYSKNSLSYLVPKDYSTEETPRVTNTYPGYFEPKHHQVTKKHSTKKHAVPKNHPKNYPFTKRYPVAKTYPVTKRYPVAKTYPVTKRYSVAKTYPVAKRYPVAKTYPVAKRYPVAKTYPVAKRYPIAKTYPVVKHHPVIERHKKESRWVFGSYPMVAGYSPIAVNLLVGGGATNIGNNTHKIVFPPTSFRTDSFTTDNEPIEVAAAAGISYDVHVGGAWEKHFLRDITWGLNGYYNQSIVNGAVFEYSLPNMANSNYDIRLKTGRLMIDTELDFSSPWGTIIPFVEVGIGAASNTLYFKNSPVPNLGTSGGGYALQDHTQFNFAYEAGLGIKVPLKNRIMLSARYLYANAGQAKTSRFSNGSDNIFLGKPIVFNVSSQSILFGFGYLIG